MKKFYEGDILADPVNEMKDPNYIHEMACFYVWLGLSGDMTLDWVIDQICLHHKGCLFDPRGKEVDLDKREPESSFGADTRRTINSFKKWADEQPKQSLHRCLSERIMWLDFALVIYLNRIELDR